MTGRWIMGLNYVYCLFPPSAYFENFSNWQKYNNLTWLSLVGEHPVHVYEGDFQWLKL